MWNTHQGVAIVSPTADLTTEIFLEYCENIIIKHVF